MSDSSDDKPKVSLDTADLKARLGLKRRVKATTDAGVDPAVAEARRKAEAEHSQAGTAEEDFTFMGQDKTPPPQPLPEKEVQGYIDFEGRKKSMTVPLVIGLTILGGVAFMLGNIFGTATQENETRDSFIQEARDKYSTIAQVKPKNSEKTTLERWISMRERLLQLNGILQKMASGYGLTNPYDQIETLVQDEEKLERVDVLVKEFMALKSELDAMKRDKIGFSPASILGKSVQNPALMVQVLDFSTKTEAFQTSLDEELARLRKVDPKYAAARVEIFKRGVAAEFKDKQIFLKKWKQPVVLDKWSLLVPDAKASATCSQGENLRKVAACGACCQKELGDRFQEERLRPRAACDCLVDSAPEKACRPGDEKKEIKELPCPNGYSCQDDGKCAALIGGTKGQIVSIYGEKPPVFARSPKGGRAWVKYIDKSRYVANGHFAAVDWDDVGAQARTAYAKEVQRDMRQIALNALNNLAVKAKAARWYGTGGLREALNEWACKSGTPEVGEPDALFDCGNEASKSEEERLKKARSDSKAAFEKAVGDWRAAVEAAEAEEAKKKKEAEEKAKAAKAKADTKGASDKASK